MLRSFDPDPHAGEKIKRPQPRSTRMEHDRQPALRNADGLGGVVEDDGAGSADGIGNTLVVP